MVYQVAESVGVGHPDKIADVIADTLLQKSLLIDKTIKFSCEVLISKGLVVVAGEVSSSTPSFSLDYHKVVSDVLDSFDYLSKNFQIVINIKEQSLNIQKYSFSKEKIMASGDQSIVIGYATSETSRYVPLSFVLASDIVKDLYLKKVSGEIKGIKYDSKCMVILSESNKVDKVYISIHHSEGLDLERLGNDIYDKVVVPVMNKYEVSVFRDEVFVNSSGEFSIGGLDADTGVVNRKIVVDSYGPIVRHGGGGYSGKDLSKVDRLGAYYARWICKNFVASGLCSFMELELVYFCGCEEPIFNLTKSDFLISSDSVIKCIKSVFPVKFLDIYKRFNSNFCDYSNLAKFGHFGREDLILPWEELTYVEDIKQYFS